MNVWGDIYNMPLFALNIGWLTLFRSINERCARARARVCVCTCKCNWMWLQLQLNRKLLIHLFMARHNAVCTSFQLDVNNAQHAICARNRISECYFDKTQLSQHTKYSPRYPPTPSPILSISFGLSKFLVFAFCVATQFPRYICPQHGTQRQNRKWIENMAKTYTEI